MSNKSADRRNERLRAQMRKSAFLRYGLDEPRNLVRISHQKVGDRHVITHTTEPRR